MSLDNFQMADALVVELYKDSLIDLDEKQNVTKSLKITSQDYLGEYKKKILIPVKDATATHLADAPMQQLTGILNACQLSFTDIALLNVNGWSDKAIQEQIDYLEPEIVICFTDLILQQLQLRSPEKYKIYKQANRTIVWSSSLTELPSDKAQRVQLWDCLQKIFLNP